MPWAKKQLPLFRGLFLAALAACDGGPVHHAPSTIARYIDFEDASSEDALYSGDFVQRTPPSNKYVFDDNGAFFALEENQIPEIFGSTIDLCDDCWITAEIRTLNGAAKNSDFIATITDPQNAENTVLQLTSPYHTDGVILRSRFALPENYRISYRIGYVDYGGTGEWNGYDSGDESGEPWVSKSAINHNGVYWLSILDTRPAPHNNVWSHHHRKFFIDAWNTTGRMRGVTVAAVNGLSSTHPQFGKEFITYTGSGWVNGSVEPAFFYLPEEWYEVSFSRVDNVFTFSVKGTFAQPVQYSVGSQLDAALNCVYHYNRSRDELDSDCGSREILRVAGKAFKAWPADRGYPDYFMMGDPHINFYEGSVLIDDLTLEAL